MSPDWPGSGFALLCDGRGLIKTVLQNGLGLQGLRVGTSLRKMADSDSRIKLLNFLAEVRGSGAACGWEVNLVQAGQLLSVQLGGALGRDALLIIGTFTLQDGLNLCDVLIDTCPDQASTLRAKMQAASALSGDSTLFNEISRLNNELITLQRDLAKKNAELEQLNAHVQQLAITDSLTGLYNRRGLFELGEREVERAKRFGRPLAAIMFDIDYFKQINDTHGHAMGDQLLAEISTRCSQQLRRVDIFGRYGGDEFSILLPETELAGAHHAAERMRQSALVPIEVGTTTMSFSISLGVAMLKGTTTGLPALLHDADGALYKAKTSGRNCVYVDEEEVAG